MNSLTARPTINIKTIALPASHGGWGFLLEPLLLGLWVAPSVAGLWLGMAATGAFLAQQPLKLALSDWRKNRRYPRTTWAERFALLYLSIAAIGFVLALLTAAGSFWLPLVIAAPLVLVQLIYDAQNRGRKLLPELSGAGALGALASAIALAAGWPVALSLALWLILLARAVGSIFYVRARLRLERSQAVSSLPVLAAHIGALLLVTALAWFQLAPWLAAIAMVVLLVRAIYGLSARRRPAQPKIIGFQEMGYGILLVALTAAGYGG
jgi:hypothetical protein